MELRLLKLVSALSLVLLVAVIALWVRSWIGRRYALEYRPERGEQWRLVCFAGRFHVEHWAQPDPVVMQNLGHQHDVLSAEWEQYMVWRRSNMKLAQSDAPKELREMAAHKAAVARELHKVDRQLSDLNRQARTPQLRTPPHPLAGPALALALGAMTSPLAVTYRRYRRGRRIAKKLCPQCLYDLRDSRERCPECGEPVPELTPQAA